jgi:hypothetical protein
MAQPASPKITADDLQSCRSWQMAIDFPIASEANRRGFSTLTCSVRSRRPPNLTFVRRGALDEALQSYRRGLYLACASLLGGQRGYLVGCSGGIPRRSRQSR